MYKPGSEMHIADTLSRAFIDVDPKGKDSLKLHVHSVMEHYPASAKKINEYKLSTAKDKTSQLIMMFLKTRWPNRKDIDPKLIPYYDHRHEIYEEDGLLFLSNKLIIPESERDILSCSFLQNITYTITGLWLELLKFIQVKMVKFENVKFFWVIKHWIVRERDSQNQFICNDRFISWCFF